MPPHTHHTAKAEDNFEQYDENDYVEPYYSDGSGWEKDF